MCATLSSVSPCIRACSYVLVLFLAFLPRVRSAGFAGFLLFIPVLLDSRLASARRGALAASVLVSCVCAVHV